MLSASRGVKNAETAVPIMPMPNTPVANPRRFASYHALENGTPTAKIVPATPRTKPATISSGKLFRTPARATSSTGGTEASSTKVNILRPPKRSVSAPTGTRPSAPTSTGMASMSEICPSSRPSSVAYVFWSGRDHHPGPEADRRGEGRQHDLAELAAQFGAFRLRRRRLHVASLARWESYGRAFWCRPYRRASCCASTPAGRFDRGSIGSGEFLPVSGATRPIMGGDRGSDARALGDTRRPFREASVSQAPSTSNQPGDRRPARRRTPLARPLPASGRGVARPARRVPRGRAPGRRLLPRPLVARQGGALHARRELHGLLLVEGVRQGRHHHLGDAADRLPVDRRGLARVRAARLPARGRVQLVHLLAHAGALPLHPRHAARALPRGEGAHRGDPVRRVGGAHRRPRGVARPTSSARGKGGLVRATWDEAARDRRRRARAHDQEVRARPGRGLLADPRDVDGLARRGRALHQPDRRHDAVVLRLVRRPARREPAGLRRPDRRARVGRLVELELPHRCGARTCR